MRRFYADASAFIRLTKVGQAVRSSGLEGEVFVPGAVAGEIRADERSTRVGKLDEEGVLTSGTPDDFHEHRAGDEILREAVDHLGRGVTTDASGGGDVALSALGLVDGTAVIVTDDEPLRKPCKALCTPISGSIGVVTEAVERGDLEPDGAKDALVAMDEAGARLSARSLRKAERLIDEAPEEREE